MLCYTTWIGEVLHYTISSSSHMFMVTFCGNEVQLSANEVQPSTTKQHQLRTFTCLSDLWYYQVVFLFRFDQMANFFSFSHSLIVSILPSKYQSQMTYPLIFQTVCMTPCRYYHFTQNAYLKTTHVYYLDICRPAQIKEINCTSFFLSIKLSLFPQSFPLSYSHCTLCVNNGLGQIGVDMTKVLVQNERKTNTNVEKGQTFLKQIVQLKY